MDHLNESPARVSKFHENNVSWSPTKCEKSCIVFPESLAKDTLISTKGLSKTDVSKNSVNIKPFSDSKSSLNDQHNTASALNRVRVENPSGIIFEQININLIRNKFDLLMNMIKNEIDIFMISETKIDNSISIYYDRLLNSFQT